MGSGRLGAAPLAAIFHSRNRLSRMAFALPNSTFRTALTEGTAMAVQSFFFCFLTGTPAGLF